MKIAIAATYDVTNVNFWSGTAFYIYQLIQKHYPVTPIKVNFNRPLISKLRGLYFNRLLKQRYFTTFDLSVYNNSRKHFDTLFKEKYDIIFTYDFFLIPALSKYAKHTILITDATFDNLLNYYDYRTNLCPTNIKDGHTIQKQAFENMTYALFSSNWAINNAVDRYSADKKKFKTLFYGSNLSGALNEDEVQKVVQQRINDPVIKLFFPAVYWDRKGGDYAIAVVNKLNELGVNSKLIIAGCSVPEGAMNENIINVGFLNKKIPEQEMKLMECYKDAHFLIMPTKADCTPIVFSEANSFALPVVSSITGGIQTVVNNKNNNGAAFGLDENFIEKASAYIIGAIRNREYYEKLCFSSFKTYQTQLNWSIGEKMLMNIIQNLSK
jgi:glycosyltransferase involved in cell wall biosynthesis